MKNLPLLYSFVTGI